MQSDSSTCPCSAALSRQLLQQKFLADFATTEHIAKITVANWLLEQGSYATRTANAVSPLLR
ncbi:hypothetical protein [Alishewanella longhuensis]